MFKALFISVALLGVPSIASAEPTQEQRVVVSKDLDLSTQQGVRTLERRIAEACGETSAFDLEGRIAIAACRAEAPAKAAAAGQRYVLAQRAKAGTIELAASGSH